MLKCCTKNEVNRLRHSGEILFQRIKQFDIGKENFGTKTQEPDC